MKLTAAEYQAQQAKKPKGKPSPGTDKEPVSKKLEMNGKLKEGMDALTEKQKIMDSLVVKYPACVVYDPDTIKITTFEGNHYEITLTLKK